MAEPESIDVESDNVKWAENPPGEESDFVNSSSDGKSIHGYSHPVSTPVHSSVFDKPEPTGVICKSSQLHRNLFTQSLVTDEHQAESLIQHEQPFYRVRIESTDNEETIQEARNV